MMHVCLFESSLLKVLAELRNEKPHNIIKREQQSCWIIVFSIAAKFKMINGRFGERKRERDNSSLMANKINNSEKNVGNYTTRDLEFKYEAVFALIITNSIVCRLWSCRTTAKWHAVERIRVTWFEQQTLCCKSLLFTLGAMGGAQYGNKYISVGAASGDNQLTVRPVHWYHITSVEDSLKRL